MFLSHILQQLFDILCSLLHEESLLLRTVETAHFNSCQQDKVAANRILVFIEKFVHVFQKSKVHICSSFLLSLVLNVVLLPQYFYWNTVTGNVG